MSLPYFREWVDDWRASPMVRLMTLEQRGAYHEMLCVSWQIGALPDDHSLLSRLLGIDVETFERVWVYPLIDCWAKTELGLVNVRLEKERKWAETRQQKASKAGRKSGNVRSIRTPDELGANSEPTRGELESNYPEPEPEPEPEPRSKEQKAVAPQRARLSPVRWEPKPTWKKGHPSLEIAQLIVAPEHLAALKTDFPRVEGGNGGGGVEADIRKFNRHWLDNPSAAKPKRDWRKTLTNWLKRTDQRFDDARFKAENARASPVLAAISGEHAHFLSQRPEDEIRACEKDHPEAHVKENLITSGERSLGRWCKHKCGFVERKT